MLTERRIRREPLALGETVVTTEEHVGGVGFDFAIHRLAAGSERRERTSKEALWVLLDGEAELTIEDRTVRVRRGSLFDEAPTTLSVGASTSFRVRSITETEWAVARVRNDEAMSPRIVGPDEVEHELRGRGLAQDMSLRTVRLVFDPRTRPESKLVVGEVVSLPGRWSSYPPHHHPQPELYHYRFTAPQGYGHAELGEHVLQVRTHDTVLIPPGETHAQVAAPGYGMYYLWIIRHLDGAPYRGFDYAPEHRWLLDPSQQGWRPRHG